MSELDKILSDAYDVMKDTMDKAEESTVPYAVVTDESVKVLGDANNTKSVKSDYVVSFFMPKDKVENKDVGVKAGDRIIIMKEYKDIELTVEKQVVISSYLAELVPYFYKPTQDGKVIDYEEAEQIEIRKYFADEKFLNSLKVIIQVLLDLKDEEAQYVSYGTLLRIVTQLFKEHPEVINEAYSFFV